MKVSKIMTQTVASLNPNDNIEHAAQLMREYNIGSIPVCNGEKVIGIITDRDIVIRSTAEGENGQKQTVRDIMTSNPVTINSNVPVNEVARIMSERQIRRIPVVDNNNLVGMVSLGDVSVEPELQDKAADALTMISEPSTPNM